MNLKLYINIITIRKILQVLNKTIKFNRFDLFFVN